MKTLILLILLLIPSINTQTMDDSAFLFHVDARDITDTMPAPIDDRWGVVFPSLMIDWSIVADEIRERKLF